MSEGARTFNPDAELPEELTGARRWICWQYRAKGDGKPTKVPVDPVTLRPLDEWQSNPARWWEFEQAVELYQANPKLSGIGIVLGDALGLIGFDLDNAFDLTTGEVAEWAAEHVRDFDTYTEVSPSGAGLRMFAIGTLPEDAPHNVKPREIYSAGRWLTITGRVWNGVPIASNSAAVDRYIEAMRKAKAERPAAQGSAGDTSSNAELVSAILAGDELHDSTRDYAFRLIDDGMVPGKVVETLRGLMLNSTARASEPGRWQERYQDIPRLVRDAEAKVEASKAPPPSDGERELDLRVVAQGEPPPRRELIEGFGLTLGEPALMAADGGVGKTLFSQQLAACIAGRVDWLGPVANPGPVLAFYCEDPIDELHRRQRGICRQFGINPASLHGSLHLRSRVGLENGLMRFDSRDKQAIEQPLLGYLEAEVARIRPRLVILDNLAQMFLGDLSDTSLATQFANRMARIAMQHDCVVYMNAHTPKSGAEFYGAVAWNNAVRTRYFMESETEADPVNPERRKPTGRTFLSRPKANYGDRTGAMILRWHDHALVRDDKPKTLAEHAAAGTRAQEVDEILLKGLADLTARRLNTSHSRRAGNYLPKVLEQYDLAGGISRKELGRGLDRLILNGRIEVDAQLWQRGNRAWVSGLLERGV